MRYAFLLLFDIRVVTLMSNDAQKIQDAAFALHALWGSPCIIIAVLVLLWYQVCVLHVVPNRNLCQSHFTLVADVALHDIQVGWATFVGLGIMLLLVPLTGKTWFSQHGMRI